MLVVCKENEGVSLYVTVGKTYEASKTYNKDHLQIFEADDGSKNVTLFSFRFKILDCNNCVDRKCNSCPVDKERK
jgi:hypothetical protein